MIKSRKMLAILMALIMAFVFPSVIFADEDIDLEIEIEDEERDLDDEEFEEEEDKDLEKAEELEEEELEEEENEEEQIKEWEALKNQIEQEKDLIEDEKEDLEDDKDDLEELYEAAEALGDTEEMDRLLGLINEIKEQIEGLKEQMKLKIEDMHEVMKDQYTEEEWNDLSAKAEVLRQNPAFTVLPVENVFYTGGNIKFDTPPVIKEGRTLISIRSVSEAMGADVTWDPLEKLAKVEKDNILIEFDMENNVISVNGEEVEVDVPAEIINGRIVVPLRFIVENMGLEIEWDSETSTIEISE